MSFPVSIELGGKRYEGSYVVKGRNPADFEVTCALGRKSGAPGSVPHQVYAEIILGEIVREAIRRSKGSTV